jgi:hypothetical protein
MRLRWKEHAADSVDAANLHAVLTGIRLPVMVGTTGS